MFVCIHRQLVFTHRQGLAEQLRREDDPAMTLHLAVTILFQTFTQTMVHAPGRVVPQIIQFLEDKMEKPSHEVLTQFQGECNIVYYLSFI